MLTLGCHSLWPDDDLIGDGHLVEVRPKVENFSGIEVGNSFLVDVTLGEREVVLKLDENIVNAGLVEFSVENGVLALRQCDGCRDFAASSGAALHVSSPNIDRVHTLGMATVSAVTNADHVVLQSSEESRLHAELGPARSATIVADGMSELELSGEVAALTLRCSEEATLTSQSPSRSADINADESAFVAARVTERVRVRAADESAVILDGNPQKREVHASDEATVSFSNW